LVARPGVYVPGPGDVNLSVLSSLPKDLKFLICVSYIPFVSFPKEKAEE